MSDHERKGTPEVTPVNLAQRELAAQQRQEAASLIQTNIHTAPQDWRAAKALTGEDRLKHANKYHSWRRQIEPALRVAGGSAYSVYLGAERTGSALNMAAWDACDRLAFTFVSLSLHPNVNYLSEDVYTANGLRNVIQKHFAPNDSQGVIRLYEDLFALRLSTTSSQGVDNFIKEYSEYTRSLAAVKLGLPDQTSTTLCQSPLPALQAPSMPSR